MVGMAAEVRAADWVAAARAEQATVAVAMAAEAMVAEMAEEARVVAVRGVATVGCHNGALCRYCALDTCYYSDRRCRNCRSKMTILGLTTNCNRL